MADDLTPAEEFIQHQCQNLELEEGEQHNSEEADSNG
jgi:hypothetical protein